MPALLLWLWQPLTFSLDLCLRELPAWLQGGSKRTPQRSRAASGTGSGNVTSADGPAAFVTARVGSTLSEGLLPVGAQGAWDSGPL